MNIRQSFASTIFSTAFVVTSAGAPTPAVEVPRTSPSIYPDSFVSSPSSYGSSDVTLIIKTDDITFTTTGTASIILTGNEYAVEANSNYFESCGNYNSDSSASAVNANNLGHEPWGAWALVATSSQFGNHSSLDITGKGYGVSGASSRVNFEVSGIGQISISVEYNFFAQKTTTAQGSFASAYSFIDVIAWSNPALWYGPDDDRVITGSASGNSDSGRMTTTFDVNGPDSMSLFVFSEASATSAWLEDC